MRWLRLLLFFLLSNTYLSSLEFGLYAKRESDRSIDRVQFFAERCSGSTYLESLIRRNFFLQKDYWYGHKHFPIWLHVPLDQQLNLLDQSVGLKNKNLRHYFDLDHNENCLFLIIFRNPYDWVRSMHFSPFHTESSLTKMNFANFIRSTWKADKEHFIMQRETARNPLIEKDPCTGLDFANVLQLRNAKNQTYLKFKEKVHNIYYINYETLRDHPKEVIEEISRLFNLEMQGPFVNIKEYKGNPSFGNYSKKNYNPIDVNDLYYINGELDPKLEKELGYDLFYPET